VPALHVAHAVAAADADTVPGAHLRQAVAPVVGVYVPDRQATHAVLVSPAYPARQLYTHSRPVNTAFGYWIAGHV